MPDVDDEFIPTRLSLLSRLKGADEDSWKEFFDTYWRLIYSVALKAGLSETEAQEVVQETVIAVSKQFSEAKYDATKGSFKAWLLRLTRWRISDQFRKRPGHWDASSPRAATDETATVEKIPDARVDLDSVWEQEWQKNLVDTAIERVKRSADPKQFQLFELLVLRNWPVSKVVGTMRVNRGVAYLAKHRIGKLVKAEVQRLSAKETP